MAGGPGLARLAGSGEGLRVSLPAEVPGLAGLRPAPRPPTCWQCGFLAGCTVTAVLNPWDRALYLSIVNRTPFFAWSNWSSPYSGLFQTLVGRSVSTGLYFPLEEICADTLGSRVLGGQAAGVVLGVALNPLSIIKYQTWGNEGRSFVTTARQLHSSAGPWVFFRGALPTAARDATFGCCFAVRRYFCTGIDHATDFAVSAACAALGTVLSSPFNYARNLTYAEVSPAGAKYFGFRHLLHLLSDVRDQGSAVAGLHCLQGRLRLGWGTARVAVGMALTDQIYGACVRAARQQGR